MSVSDKTAVVTGAGSTRGIGRAPAHALATAGGATARPRRGRRRRPARPLAPAGWHIAVLDLDEASAKDAAHEVAGRHGVQALGVGCDVTHETSAEDALTVLEDSLPPVGALVNNAGITSPTPFLEVSGEEWDGIFAVNVRGAFNVTRRLAPGMAERGFGRIVFLSSVSAERGGGVFGGGASPDAHARAPRPPRDAAPARP